MDAIEAILTRRSIRKYNKQPVSEELITKFLEVAMSAPSAGNEQPWHFIIIDDPLILSKIPTFHNHAQMLKDTSVAILVCSDMNLDHHNGMWIQDCAAATENMLIAIHAEGLGAVWLGIYPREVRVTGIKELLNIPDHIIPFSLISIGYPAEKLPKANRYNKSRIHQNNW